jgi:hypothetical protein
MLYKIDRELVAGKKDKHTTGYSRYHPPVLVRGVCSGLYLFQILIVKALDVHCIESKHLNDIE